MASTTGEREAVTEMVKRFYEDIQFPGTRPMEQDSLIFLRKFSRIIASLSGVGRPIRVLDAGCGTGNTSRALAAQFPEVSFTGIDLSTTSIETARQAAREKNLANLTYYQWNMLQELDDEQPFDIVLCFGALHHTADMPAALHTLRRALRTEGRMFIWVYGTYGRYHHGLNMSLLAMFLDAAPVEDRVGLAHEFIHTVGDNMAARDLLGSRNGDPLLRSFFENPTWIADQFLNPNERCVSMKDLHRLLHNEELQILEWIGMPKDVRSHIKSDELYRRYTLLPEDQQRIALDLLFKPERYFLMLRRQEGA
ncbi:class I SAM-dependent methyltransferase [bacterium]|nr:class I SAM-dependent methyltransferase [bacterium]